MSSSLKPGLLLLIFWMPIVLMAQSDQRCDSLFFELVEQQRGHELRTASIDAYMLGEKTEDEELMVAAQAAWMHSYHLQFEEAPISQWDFKLDPGTCGSAILWKQGVQSYFQGDQISAMRLFDLASKQSPNEDLRREMVLNMAGLSAIMGNPVLALDRLNEFLTILPAEMPIPALAGLLVVQMQVGPLNELFDLAERRFYDEPLDIRESLILGTALLASFTLHESFDRADEIFAELSSSVSPSTLKLNAFQVLNFYLLARDRSVEWRAMRPQFLEWRMKNRDLELNEFASVNLLWNARDIELNFDENWAMARDLVALDMNEKREERVIFQSILHRDAEGQFEAIEVLSPWKSSWAFVLVGIVLGTGVMVLWMRLRKKKSAPESAITGEGGWSEKEVHSLGRLRRYLETSAPDKFGLILLDQFQHQRKAEIMECIEQQYPGLGLSTTFQEVLALSVQGFSGKETAQILDVSLGHVYNIRTQLKASLEMGEVDFPQWYRALNGPG